MTNQTQKYTFHVHGMHCNACVLMTESELGDLPNITYVKSSLKNHSVEVIGDFGEKTPEQIAEELTIPLKSHGYTVSVEKRQHTANWGDFKIAAPIALGFVVLFGLLQKIGIVNLIGGGNVTYGTAFVIGIVASLSTCMAVVGGLVLSMSATFAKEGDKIRPQLMFHGARIVAFFILGGVIGAIGSAFTLSTSATFILSIIIGIVMLILGINLLDTFHWAKRFQVTMPKSIARHVHGQANSFTKFNHMFTPLLVGVATFFYPVDLHSRCSFIPSQQVAFLKEGLPCLRLH